MVPICYIVDTNVVATKPGTRAELDRILKSQQTERGLLYVTETVSRELLKHKPSVPVIHLKDIVEIPAPTGRFLVEVFSSLHSSRYPEDHKIDTSLETDLRIIYEVAHYARQLQRMGLNNGLECVYFTCNMNQLRFALKAGNRRLIEDHLFSETFTLPRIFAFVNAELPREQGELTKDRKKRCMNAGRIYDVTMLSIR
jgi:hypothetical protein